MKNESLKTWANQELNGYPDPKVVPEYRIIPAGATGIFNAGYAFPTITRSIPPGAMEEGHRYVAREVRLCEPVSAYENALKAGKEYVFRYDWPADILAHYQAEFIERHALTHAWQEVPFGAIAGMLDTIRTRVLNVALDIEREIGETDADLKKVPDSSHTVESVNHIVINHIYSGTVFQGDHQTVNVQNISVGNWRTWERPSSPVGFKTRKLPSYRGPLTKTERHSEGRSRVG
jgi:AbiTii